MVHTSQSNNSSDGDNVPYSSIISECHEDSTAGELAVALVKVADQSMDMEGAMHLLGWYCRRCVGNFSAPK